MAEAVNEIRAERFAAEIFSVGVDVIVGEFVDAFVALGTVIRTGLQCSDGSILRTEDDVVDFALAWRELAISGQRARDVRGGTGGVSADLEDGDVALFYLAGGLVVGPRRRYRAGSLPR